MASSSISTIPTSTLHSDLATGEEIQSALKDSPALNLSKQKEEDAPLECTINTWMDGIPDGLDAQADTYQNIDNDYHINSAMHDMAELEPSYFTHPAASIEEFSQAEAQGHQAAPMAEMSIEGMAEVNFCASLMEGSFYQVYMEAYMKGYIEGYMAALEGPEADLDWAGLAGMMDDPFSFADDEHSL